MRKVILIILFISLNTILCFGQSAKMYRQSFNRFLELDSSTIILIPIEWDNNAKVGDIKIQGSNRTKNILFYDPTNDYQKFLFDEQMQIIESYNGHLLNRRHARDTTKRPLNKEHIYYSVINEDYNEDKKLDSDDPTYLYYSKVNGTELYLLTPKFYHLKNYKYIERSNIILATLVMDENGDKKFNNNDSEVLYKIDLNELSESKIISKLKLKSESE